MNNLKQEEKPVVGAGTLPEPAAGSGIAIERQVWKRFILKNVLIYVLTNVFFNSVIPYNSFEHPAAVYLFRGAYCIARFLLPLAFFIPLLVTIDTGNKIRALFRKQVPGFSFPDGFRYKQFLLKRSLLNGSITFLLTLALMAIVHFSLPQEYTFHGIPVSILMGIYAGCIALYFMKRTITRFIAQGIIFVKS